MSKASDRAYAQIRAMILSGELASGSQIAEVQLAATCGVSRTPVREALRRLEAEALVRRTDTQRSFVADWSLDDVEDGFEMRGMMEALAARRAAQRLTPAELAELTACNAALERAITRPSPDIAAFLEANRQFHAIITEAAASPRLAAMLAGVTEQPVVLRTARNYDIDNLRRSWREHDELLAAFAARDGEWAHAVMVAHIRRAFHAYADAHRGSPAAFAEAAE
jgi:DNA-binding GntR family transcriptional regulator